MKRVLTVDHYMATWDVAVTNHPELRAGMRVRTKEYPDAREWDGFSRDMRHAGLRLEWVRFLPRLKLDEYRLVPDEDRG